MADQIWYRDGKVKVETGNNIVVGLGTFWLTTIRVGDIFSLTKDGPAREFYEILSVDEDRQITLSQPWQGENETNAEYAIIRNFTGRWSISADLAYQIESLVRQFKSALQNNLKGDKGDPGKDGNTILGGPSAPASTDGKEGDWYLNSSTWDIYRKEGAGWIRRGSLIGPKGEPGKDGVRWYYDETPSASVGNIGDINFNGTTGDIHRRTATGWESIGNFKGPQGKQGPKGDTGPKGEPARWLSGSGVPSGALGANGDMYLNVDTSEVYRKASDVWVLQGSIKGRVGDPGPVGPTGITWRGAWDSVTEYAKNDAVQYTGNVWIAKTGSTNITPPAIATTPSTSTWDLLAAKGADGLGSGDMLQSVYDPDKTGKVLSAKSAEHATTADTATSAGTAATVPWNGVQDIPSASLSAPGVVQLATAESTTEGASETLAVTPAGLKALLVVNIVDALDSDRADAALSAAQGKVLNTRKQDKAPEEITINIAANGNDSTGDGSAGKPYKTLPKAVNVLGGMVGQTIATINIGPGTYEMNELFFQHIQIAKIKLQAANPEEKPVLHLLDGHYLGIFNHHGVKFIDCYNLCFKRSPTSTGESLVTSGYTGCIGFSGCEFIGNMKTGLYVGFGSAARIAGCTFKLCDVAVSVVEGASAYISGCATEQSTVNKALFCRGASAFVVSSPNFKGKNVNVEKNNGLVIGL